MRRSYISTTGNYMLVFNATQSAYNIYSDNLKRGIILRCQVIVLMGI